MYTGSGCARSLVRTQQRQQQIADAAAAAAAAAGGPSRAAPRRQSTSPGVTRGVDGELPAWMSTEVDDKGARAQCMQCVQCMQYMQGHNNNRVVTI